MSLIIYPELRQTYDYDCGLSMLCSALAYAGFNVRESKLMALAGTTPEDGTSYEGMERVLKHYGVSYEPCNTLPALWLRLQRLRQPVIMSLQAYRDKPVAWEEDDIDGHYVTAIGVVGDRVVYEDPSSYHRTWIDWAELGLRWHDVNGGVRMRWGLALTCPSQFQPDFLEHME